MGSTNASVTVLMGVHDGQPYLGTSIRSVLDQTYRDFEFLIIDDASTDGSRSVLREWSDRDQRIRLVFRDENRGLGHVLAEGLRLASSPLIARMDADDVALPERLERQVRYLTEHPEVDVLGTWAVDVDEEGRVLGERRYPVDHREIVDLIWTIPLIHPSVMFRRAPVLSAGSYRSNLRRRQDYDLWFRCVEAGLHFANLPEVLLKYRFTDKYYDRNDVRVAWTQVKIGLRGCWRIGASPRAYVGVFAPLVRALVPVPWRRRAHELMSRFDPRRTSNSESCDVDRAVPDGAEADRVEARKRGSKS